MFLGLSPFEMYDLLWPHIENVLDCVHRMVIKIATMRRNK